MNGIDRLGARGFTNERELHSESATDLLAIETVRGRGGGLSAARQA